MVNVHTTRPLDVTDNTQEEVIQHTSPLPNLKPQGQQRTGKVGRLAHPNEAEGPLKRTSSPLGLAIDRLLDTAEKSNRANDTGQGVAGLRLHLIA